MNTTGNQRHVSSFRCALFSILMLCLFIAAVAGAFPAESVGMTLSVGPMQKSVFEDGNKQFKAGKIHVAHKIWQNLFSDPLYGPVAYVMLARAYGGTGKPSLSESLLKDFLKTHPDSVYVKDAERSLVEVLCRQRKAEAEPLLKTMIRRANGKDVPKYLFLLAKLQRQKGNYSDAVVNYRKLFLKYPASVEGLKSSEDLAWMVVHGKIPRPVFSEKEHRSRARRLFLKGRFNMAADSYTYLLKKNPGDDGLLIRLAECRYKARKNHEAIRILKGVLKKKPTEKNRTEALYLLSRLYWRLDKNKDFVECCNGLLKTAKPRMREKVLFNLGAHYYEQGKFHKSLSYFTRLLNTTSRQSTKADVQWKIAWIYFRQGDYKKAGEAFRMARVHAAGGRITNASRYWQARCMIQVNRRNEARALLNRIVRSAPLDYYGQRSARLLESMGFSAGSGRAGHRSFPNLSLTTADLTNKRISDAKRLMESGLHEFALINLEALPKSARSSPAMVFLMAKAAYGSEQYRKARDILSATFASAMTNPPKDAPAEFIDMAFPRVHQKATTRAAKRHSIDPNLVWAVIRQESLYDASAVSPAGALGLMQVTPGAAGVVSRHGRVPAKAIAKLLEPEKNVAYGVRILSGNLRSFKGQIVPAVASYNADIKKVRGWVKKNGHMKQDVFIENIPYLETRLYVKKVLAGYQAYSLLHRKKDIKGLW